MVHNVRTTLKFRDFDLRNANEQLTNTNNSEETVHKEKGHI